MWDTRYRRDDYVFGTAPNTFLQSVVGQIPPGRVLCIAEGEGRNAVFLAEQGFVVTAMDGSTVGMQKAAALAQQRGVTISTTVADLSDYHIEPDSWDAIVSIFAHLPPSLRRAVHRQVVAGLRGGGVFVLEAYTPSQLAFGTGGPSSAELMPTLEALHNELDGLEFVTGQETERDVVEGVLHTGRAAVVQVLAQKH